MAVTIDGYSETSSWLLLHPVVTCCCVFCIGTLALYEVELRMEDAVVPACRVLSCHGIDVKLWRVRTLGTTNVESVVAGSSVADG
jgi:hypothetical protein